MKVTDIASTIAPDSEHEIIGIRPGEKLHEEMISIEDGDFTYEFDDYFKILPQINNWHTDPKRIKEGKKVEPGFSYSSENNLDWMSQEQLKAWLKKEYSEE